MAPVAGAVVAVVLAVPVVLVPAVTVPPRLPIHHVLDAAALVIQSAITVQSVQYSIVQYSKGTCHTVCKYTKSNYWAS